MYKMFSILFYSLSFMACAMDEDVLATSSTYNLKMHNAHACIFQHCTAAVVNVEEHTWHHVLEGEFECPHGECQESFLEYVRLYCHIDKCSLIKAPQRSDYRAFCNEQYTLLNLHLALQKRRQLLRPEMHFHIQDTPSFLAFLGFKQGMTILLPAESFSHGVIKSKCWFRECKKLIEESKMGEHLWDHIPNLEFECSYCEFKTAKKSARKKHLAKCAERKKRSARSRGIRLSLPPQLLKRYLQENTALLTTEAKTLTPLINIQ